METDKNVVSSCCGKPIYANTDFCSDCKEHCGAEASPDITTFTKNFFEGMFNLHKPMTKGEFIDNEIKQEKEEELLDSDEDFSNTFPVEGKII